MPTESTITEVIMYTCHTLYRQGVIALKTARAFEFLPRSVTKLARGRPFDVPDVFKVMRRAIQFVTAFACKVVRGFIVVFQKATVKK